MIRLVGAVLIDIHDEWIAGDRRYLSEESMALLNTTMDTGEHAAIEAASRAPRTTSKPTTQRGSARHHAKGPAKEWRVTVWSWPHRRVDTCQELPPRPHVQGDGSLVSCDDVEDRLETLVASFAQCSVQQGGAERVTSSRRCDEGRLTTAVSVIGKPSRVLHTAPATSLELWVRHTRPTTASSSVATHARTSARGDSQAGGSAGQFTG